MNQKQLSSRTHLSNLVRDREQRTAEHRIELALLLDREEWLADKENYLPYHDPIWWMGHDDTTVALSEIWNDALNGKIQKARQFGSKNLTSLYKRTKMLSYLSEPKTFWQRLKYLFTGKVS